MILANSSGCLRQPSRSGESGTCPLCEMPVMGRCGPIVVHHWAHLATAPCDGWALESEWHREWKQTLADTLGARMEVVMGEAPSRHFADAVIGSFVVELQASYQSAAVIAERETFYGDMCWLYSAELFADRFHFGRHGFWLKHGPKSLLAHERPVFVSNHSGSRFLELRRLGLVDGRMLGKHRTLTRDGFMFRLAELARVQLPAVA